MIAPAGQSTARACLRSKLAALVVRRQAGPATWGLHAPKTPNKEVGRPTGYANAVLLFALNACGPSSVLKFGSSLEPPQGEQQRCRGGIYAARNLPRQPVNGKGAGLPPSLAPLVRDPFTAVCRGRACPARSLAITTPFILCIVGRGLDPSAGASGTPPPTTQSAGLLITANVRGGLGAGRPTSRFTTFRGAGLRPQLIHATL